MIQQYLIHFGTLKINPPQMDVLCALATIQCVI